MIGAPRTGACEDLATRLAPDALAAAAGDLADVVRMRVFDTLGALGAGRAVAASRVLATVQAAASGGSAGLLDEVRLLCATVRCSEVDDIHIGSCTTPGSLVVPVALAVGAARGASGRAVMAGVVAGYEAMVRHGEAADGANVLRQGVWPSHLAAPLGAAATTAAVLGLDRERTGHALAIAASRAVGTAGKIVTEPTSRWLTFGCAAADGVLAALAAEAGMLGDPRVLDTAPGPVLDLGAFGPDADPAWRIEHIDVKPFVTARQAQSAVQAARGAAAELGALPETVDVGVPGAYRAMIDQPEPTERMLSFMGAGFQIAAALTREALLFDARREDLALPGAGAAIVLATRVHVDEELDELYPAHYPARVTVRADGREARCLVVDPVGSAECPLSWDELRTKHARLGGFGPHLDRSLAVCRGLVASEETAPWRALLDASTQDRPQEVSP